MASGGAGAGVLGDGRLGQQAAGLPVQGVRRQASWLRAEAAPSLYQHKISPSQRRADRAGEGLVERGGSQLSIRRTGEADCGGDDRAAVGIELDV
jgi:hypothetical protein